MGRNIIKRKVKLDKHIFYLEIYLRIETAGLSNSQEVTWEVFPSDYQACLYAFSNKKKLNQHIEDKYINEPTNKLNVPRKFRLENAH